MEALKLQSQSLGGTPQLHTFATLPSPSRSRLRNKPELPGKRGSAARGSAARVSIPAVYDEAETALEETRNQCSELQEKIARFQEEIELERSALRRRFEKRARGIQQEEKDEEECIAEQEEVPTEKTEDAEVEQRQNAELCCEGVLTLRLPAEAAPQPGETAPVVQPQRKSRKHRQQSTDSNQIEPRSSRRRARRHSEPAVQTRQPSVPQPVSEDDVISPTGEAFIKSLGRHFNRPDPEVITGELQPDRRRRHSAPPTPEQVADMNAELNAAEPRRGMLAKLLNFVTPQWMRADCVHNYAAVRRSQSRRKDQKVLARSSSPISQFLERRSKQAGQAVRGVSRTSSRVAVYASMR